MSHSGTRQIPHDSDKENAMDINLDKQVEDNEPTTSSKYEKILNNETYDPDQDKDEKRWLRREYRNLISETEEKRQDYLRSDSDGLALNIAKANELVQKVKNTHEATLDSRLLVLTSDLGVQKARRMKLDNNAFDVDAYISKLITFMGGRQVDDDDEEPDLDWNAIGELASHHTLRVPTMEFILGPLSVEQKERVRGIRQTVAKNKNDMVMPKQLEEKDIERQENETTKNVRNIYNILMEKQPINFFEFIVNPESFGQTIENLFYLSFLVRDAKVNIDDESGQPILTCCEPPTGDEYAEGLIKKQLVMGIDMNTWKELIEVYNIRVSAIPTRQSCTQISGKWYG
ncbi:Nse4 C-terminal-domain-containing protein [Gigaspora rosea]|uniref:Non-structural maintenance of chromosomes element 4 n=1 Tax=Gigaspora rosea TaxID=44941 RepID=A0A397UJI2_9GLOM|nr:Nse4 C-terminal-domain-containing protein [Gigaspora rosea]